MCSPVSVVIEFRKGKRGSLQDLSGGLAPGFGNVGDDGVVDEVGVGVVGGGDGCTEAAVCGAMDALGIAVLQEFVPEIVISGDDQL